MNDQVPVRTGIMKKMAAEKIQMFLGIINTSPVFQPSSGRNRQLPKEQFLLYLLWLGSIHFGFPGFDF
jgi:hypothetical protein